MRLGWIRRLVTWYSRAKNRLPSSQVQFVMFRRIQFPPEAVVDILAVTRLNGDQLDLLNGFLNSAAAVEPVDSSFLETVANELEVAQEVADQVLRVGVVLKRLNLDYQVSSEILDDMLDAIELHAEESERKSAIGSIAEHREQYLTLITRSEARARVLRRRMIQQGTQPTIEEIRTLVQLRPLFAEDDTETPVGIECLIPAMTLELKFQRDDRNQSATFSLNRETLNELIKSLERAKAKWDLMLERYADEICEEER